MIYCVFRQFKFSEWLKVGVGVGLCGPCLGTTVHTVRETPRQTGERTLAASDRKMHRARGFNRARYWRHNSREGAYAAACEDTARLRPPEL